MLRQRIAGAHLLRRTGYAAAIVALLAAAIALFDTAASQTYHLRISGGHLLSNRHMLARQIQSEIAGHGFEVEVVPTGGATETLDMLDEGTLDLGLVAGHLDDGRDNIVQVAAIAPELLHLLVRPGIATIADLRGKMVQTGATGKATRDFVHETLSFAGLVPGRDYLEVGYDEDRLADLPGPQLPDAVFLLSFAPSPLADRLVREHGYRMAALPFGKALSLRQNWAGPATIIGRTYAAEPPVPAEDLPTIGVTVMLVANRALPADAAYRLLTALAGPAFAARTGIVLDDTSLLPPSGLPVSEGALRYLRRHDPIVAAAPLLRLARNAAALGLVALAIAATLLWVRAERRVPAPLDASAPVAPQGVDARETPPPKWHGFLFRRNGAA